MVNSAALPAGLLDVARQVGELLRSRSETVGVAESAAGGLVSAALLAVPGASAFYAGGAVVYTRAAGSAFLGPSGGERPADLRGATEAFARYEADSVRAALAATWGLGETGAAGPAGNAYGDPPGHAWVAVSGPRTLTEQVSTGRAERLDNMVEFASAALRLLHRAVLDSSAGGHEASPQ